MKDGDTFILYIHSHGGTFKPETVQGNESTKSAQDEFVEIGPSHEGTPYPAGALSDNELTSYLQGIDNINKWVIIDACHAGGFWGNNNPNDSGDLEKLKKVGLLAACGEDETTQFQAYNYGVFTEGLAYAFSINEKGKLNADLNQDGKLDFNELYIYMHQYWSETDKFKNEFVGKILYEAEYGDAVIFSKEMWNPQAVKVDDIGTINVSKPKNISSIISILLID